MQVIIMIVIIFNNSHPNSLTPANRKFLSFQRIVLTELNSDRQHVIAAECSENVVHELSASE